MKTPRVTSTPFSFCSRQLVSSFADTTKVFKCNDLAIGFSLLHQLIADCMILMGLKTSLFTGQLFQQFPTTSTGTACAFRGFLLELGSQVAVMVTNNSNLFSAISIILRGNAYISPSQIAAQHFIRFLGVVRCRFELNIQIISTVISFYQSSCFGFLSFQQSQLVVTNLQIKPFTSTHYS